MTSKEIDTHIESWEAFDENSLNNKDMFTRAELMNFKLCNILFLISPILHFISKNWLVKKLKPGWVKAINIALDGADGICNLTK